MIRVLGTSMLASFISGMYCDGTEVQRVLMPWGNKNKCKVYKCFCSFILFHLIINGCTIKFTCMGLFTIFNISVWISLSFLRNLNCAPSTLWETEVMFWVITVTLYTPCGKTDTQHTEVKTYFVIAFLRLACSLLYYKTVVGDSCHLA